MPATPSNRRLRIASRMKPRSSLTLEERRLCASGYGAVHMSRPVIISAVRTPIGRYGGALAGTRPDDLAALVVRAAVERAGVEPEDVEDVFLGCANQAGEDN